MQMLQKLLKNSNSRVTVYHDSILYHLNLLQLDVKNRVVSLINKLTTLKFYPNGYFCLLYIKVMCCNSSNIGSIRLYCCCF